MASGPGDRAGVLTSTVGRANSRAARSEPMPSHRIPFFLSSPSQGGEVSRMFDRVGAIRHGLFLCVFCLHNPFIYALCSMNTTEYLLRLRIVYAKSNMLGTSPVDAQLFVYHFTNSIRETLVLRSLLRSSTVLSVSARAGFAQSIPFIPPGSSEPLRSRLSGSAHPARSVQCSFSTYKSNPSRRIYIFSLKKVYTVYVSDKTKQTRMPVRACPVVIRRPHPVWNR